MRIYKNRGKAAATFLAVLLSLAMVAVPVFATAEADPDLEEPTVASVEADETEIPPASTVTEGNDEPEEPDGSTADEDQEPPENTEDNTTQDGQENEEPSPEDVAATHEAADAAELVAAIAAANPGDTILLTTSGQYVYFSAGVITVDKDLTIDGQGNGGSFKEGERHFIVEPGVALTLQNLTLYGGGGSESTGYLPGGGIEVRSGAILTLGNVQIDYCYATDGGAIHATDATVAMNNSSIRRGLADGKGGAIYALNSTLSIQASALYQGRADQGGAIYAENSAVTMQGNQGTNQMINTNTARQGAGVYLVGSTFTGQNGNIAYSNYFTTTGAYPRLSYEEGGIFYAIGSTITLNAVNMDRNLATNKGGAVYLDGSSEFNVTGSELSGNSAQFGGAIYGEAGSVIQLQNGELNGNSAQQGGAIYVEDYNSFSLSNLIWWNYEGFGSLYEATRYVIPENSPLYTLYDYDALCGPTNYERDENTVGRWLWNNVDINILDMTGATAAARVTYRVENQSAGVYVQAGKSHTVLSPSALGLTVGEKFLGWATDANATAAQYTAGGSLAVGTSNITLIAIFEADVVTPPGGGDENNGGGNEGEGGNGGNTGNEGAGQGNGGTEAPKPEPPAASETPESTSPIAKTGDSSASPLIFIILGSTAALAAAGFLYLRKIRFQA